uniref:LRAT domain-containing protein n=1 Tax=Salix viminalis TaxID=40686 RepID=A0A6N2KKE6_SALVM
MGFLSHRVERSEIKPGDHIYTYRAVFTYSHHGIFVGGSKVVHFTPRQNANSSSDTSSDFYDSMSSIPSSCETFPDCGFRQPDSGVVLSCLDCFLKKGSIYSFEYGVPPTVFIAKVRGGTCTTAASDPSETVIHRAMYLLQNGFGNYDIFQNNCEDFAMYCKTGLLIMDRLGVGRSGQASSVIGAPLAAILSTPLKLLMPSPVGVATVTAGMYCMSRYATDIGVRSDVIKVAVEDLATNLGWAGPLEEIPEDNESSGALIASQLLLLFLLALDTNVAGGRISMTDGVAVFLIDSGVASPSNVEDANSFKKCKAYELNVMETSSPCSLFRCSAACCDTLMVPLSRANILEQTEELR